MSDGYEGVFEVGGVWRVVGVAETPTRKIVILATSSEFRDAILAKCPPDTPCEHLPTRAAVVAKLEHLRSLGATDVAVNNCPGMPDYGYAPIDSVIAAFLAGGGVG